MGLGETPAMYLVVSEENSRKNSAFELAQNVSRIKAEAGFTWSFGAGRVLHVSIAGLTLAEKTAIQNACDTLFGSGKVMVS